MSLESDAFDRVAFEKVLEIARDTAASLAKLEELKRSEHSKLDTILNVQQSQTAALVAISAGMASLATNSEKGRDSAVKEIRAEVRGRNGLIILAACIMAAGSVANGLLRMIHP